MMTTSSSPPPTTTPTTLLCRFVVIWDEGEKRHFLTAPDIMTALNDWQRLFPTARAEEIRMVP